MNWVHDPAWSFVGAAVGIAGISIAYVFYRRSKRTKQICFDSRVFQLVSDHTTSVPGLSFSYKDTQLTDLCAVKVVIWNAGTEIVNSNDFASTDRLRLVMPAGEILHAQISYQARETNCFSLQTLESSTKSLNMEFEYIAPGEGAIVLLLTSKTQGSSPELQGTVKGFGNPRARTVKETIQSSVAYLSGGLIGISPMVVFAVLRLLTDLPFWAVAAVTGTLMVLTLSALRYIARPLAKLVVRLPPRLGIDAELVERFESDFKATEIA